VAAVGVACHEAGHAIQHAVGYKALGIRSALVPTANIGSTLGYFVMLGGLLLSSVNMVIVGAVLFSAVLLFQIVTLPVEFDASNRAKALVSQYGIVTERERFASARSQRGRLTYVAAAISTLMTLLCFLFGRACSAGAGTDRVQSYRTAAPPWLATSSRALEDRAPAQERPLSCVCRPGPETLIEALQVSDSRASSVRRRKRVRSRPGATFRPRGRPGSSRS
jgi:hypothetical protein